MRFISNPVVTSLGAAAIISVNWLAPITSNLHQTTFKMGGSLTAVLVPLFCVIGAIWLFWYLAIVLSQRSATASFWVGVALTLVMIRESIETIYGLTSPDLSSSVRYPPHWVNVLCLIVFVGMVIVFSVMRSNAPRSLEKAKQLSLTLLAFAAVSGAITFARVAVFGWQARNLNAPQPMHHEVASAEPAGPRIVWILLDELSYRQVYEHRYADLQLPAFDRLAKESVVFTDVRPIGRYTLNVIPSLLSGVPNSGTKASSSGKILSIRNSDTGRWETFNPAQTVFQDALNDGYSTAVAGWVIPYCRIASEELDHCYTALGGSWIDYLSNQRTIAQNLKPAFLGPLMFRLGNGRLRAFWDKWAGPLSLTPSKTEVVHAAGAVQQKPLGGRPLVYEKLRDASLTFLRDRSINFLYIHMNAPHPPGFFNRHTGTYDSNGTYIDNLALCDQFLGDIHSALDADGDWSNTTLVVMGDHSWRTYEWKKLGWTDEDQRATDGGFFDDRPGYIVHLAGETAPAVVTSAFSELRTRALFDAVMQRQIVTPEQLQAWAQAPPR